MCRVSVDDETNGGWFLMEFDAILVAGCGLRTIAQFKGSERTPGLFQDFENEYMKV